MIYVLLIIDAIVEMAIIVFGGTLAGTLLLAEQWFFGGIAAFVTFVILCGISRFFLGIFAGFEKQGKF